MLLTISTASLSQDFRTKYKELKVEKDDSLTVKNFLVEWESKAPQDVEMLIAFANFYVNKGRQSVLAINDHPKGESMSFYDSTSNSTQYISGLTIYDTLYFGKALNYLNRAIRLKPQRLDILFGEAYLLGDAENYKAQKDILIKAIDISDSIKNKWLWTNDSVLTDAKTYFIENLQSYIAGMANAGESNFDYIMEISQRVIKYYPDELYANSNLGMVYSIKGQYDLALKYLMKAEKVNSEDYIVLNDIALAYESKKDYKKAIEYFEKVVKYGPAEVQEFAKGKIDELRKK